MIRLIDLRCVRLGTRDPEAAAEYAQNDRDHTLVHCRGDPQSHTVGRALADAGALAAARPQAT